MVDDDLIVLVDEDGRRVGIAPKLASHHAQTPLHLAFSCYLFDTCGRFLISRRSGRKKTWPGAWSNSCCGHPLPGEDLLEAVDRRLLSELGTRCELADVVLPWIRYRATMPNGIAENELGPVLRIRPRLPIRPQPDEVAEALWVPWRDLVQEVRTGRREISPWSRITIDRLAEVGPDPWAWPAVPPNELPPALRGTG